MPSTLSISKFKDHAKRLHGLTARPPRDRMLRELEDLVETIATDSSKDSVKQRKQGAFVLSCRIATTTEAQAKSFYIELLGKLGPDAVPMLIVAALEKADSEESHTPLADAIPEGLTVYAVNHLLSGSTPLLYPLRDEAISLLPTLEGLPLAQAEAFLHHTNRYGLPIAFPVRELLLSGPYGESVSRTLTDAASKLSQKIRPDASATETLLLHSQLKDAQRLQEIQPLLAAKDAPLATCALALFNSCKGPPSQAVAKVAAKATLHSDPVVQSRALECMTAYAPKGHGKLLAALYLKQPVLRPQILSRLCLLSHAEFKSFLRLLMNKADGIPAQLFTMLATITPRAAKYHLRMAASQTEAHGKTASALEDLASAPDYSDTLDADTAAAAFSSTATPSAKPKEPKKESFFSRFSSTASETISVQFDGPTGQDSEYSGRKASPIYQERTLRGTNFSDSFLENAAFERCTFVEVDFSNALMRGTRFTGCTFLACDFAGGRLYETSFMDCRFDNSFVQDTLFAHCNFNAVCFRSCYMTGVMFGRTSITTTRFLACELTSMTMAEATAAGVEFFLSDCSNSTFDQTSLMTVSLHSSGFSNAAFEGIFTGNARLLELEDAYISRRARETGTNATELKYKKFTPAMNKLALTALDSWFSIRDTRRNYSAFLRNNKRREDWCMDKLGPTKSEFYRLAPFLIHSEEFEKMSEEVTPLPLSCRMRNYTPDFTTLEAARKHFPGALPPPTVPDPVGIESLYTIGSVGTIAQTAKSDLDYWVCFDPEEMPEMLVDSLTDKLEHIEQWADEVFGLEVHFFTMDITRIQDNNFGFSDSESSGSAQALLLKEEFYRTAVTVAGKYPLWWATPSKDDNKAYQATLKNLRGHPSESLFADLGNLVEIPPQEFFGASLWQIVKALKSPFKSIMKFGLLEKYISSKDTTGSPLICHRLKGNLLSGLTSLQHVDPYLLMFREVSGYYAGRGESEPLKLVRMAFLLKTQIATSCDLEAIPLLHEDKEIAELFKDPHICSDSSNIGAGWPFDKVVSIGGLVNKFIVRTYMRVRDSQKEAGDIAITPEDLTKLGRKIFSTFSRRNHKVEHIPFVSLGGSSFEVFHFSAGKKTMGRPSDWSIQGAQALPGKERLELVNLRQGNDLAEIITWVTANGIYNPAHSIRGDYSISPVTAKDIKHLMDQLITFFPTKATFNTDIGETLKPERIVRAFFILNLTQPREQGTISEVSIVYSTNWGELFCRTVPVKNWAALDNPAAFLLENVEQEFQTPPTMDFFIPDRSQCPKPRLN